MDKINRTLFLKYIRAKIINEGLQVKILGTDKPTDTIINKYIKKEKERLPHIEHNAKKGKGIVKILKGDIHNSNEDTLNFIATLFEISPRNLREFTKMWADKKITDKDLVIHSITESKEGIENQFNDSNSIKQTNILSAFNSSKIKKKKGKLNQLNFLGFGNKQEVEE